MKGKGKSKTETKGENKQQGGTMYGVAAAILCVAPGPDVSEMLHSNQTGITNCTFRMQSLPTG